MIKTNKEKKIILFIFLVGLFLLNGIFYISFVSSETKDKTLIICDGKKCYTADRTSSDSTIEVKETQEIIKGVKISNSKVNIVNNGRNVIVEISEQGSIEINGNKFNIKYDKTKIKPRFIFDENGKLTDGTHFIAGKDEGEFLLKGHKIKLSENTAVSFQDGIVLIILPEGGKIGDIKIEDEKEAKDVVFEFISNDEEKGRFKLPDFLGSYDFKGNLKYKNGQFHSSDEKFEIDSFSADNKKKEDVFLFGDGKKHNEILGSYLSWKKGEAFIIGKNNNGAGHVIEFKQGNEFLKNFKENQLVKIRAGRDKDSEGEAGSGVVTIQEKNGEIKVKTEGDFRIENGINGFYSGITRKGRRDVLEDKISSDKKSYPMKMYSYERDGKLLLKTTGSDKKETEWFVGIDENNNWKAYLKEEENSVRTEEPRVQGVSETEAEKEKEIKEEKTHGIKQLPRSNLNIQLNDAYKKYDYNDVLFTQEDYSTNIHEQTHIYLNKHQNGYGTYYLGNGKFATVKEVGFNQPTVSENIPRTLIYGGGEENYMVYIRGYEDRDAIHIFDDLTAYEAETRASFYAVRNGRNPGDARGLGSIMDFNIYTTALLKSVQERNPQYFEGESGIQFRGFVKQGLEEGMRLIKEAYSDNSLSIFRSEDATLVLNPETRRFFEYSRVRQSIIGRLNNLRTHPDAGGLRKTLIENYGEDWTQQVFGFRN